MYSTSQTSGIDHHGHTLRHRGSKPVEDTGDTFVKSMLFPSTQAHGNGSPVVSYSSRQQLGSSPVRAMKSPSPSRNRFESHSSLSTSTSKNPFSLPSMSLMDEPQSSPSMAPIFGPSVSYSDIATPSRMATTEQPNISSFASRRGFSPTRIGASESSQLPLTTHDSFRDYNFQVSLSSRDYQKAQDADGAHLGNWAVVFGYVQEQHLSNDVIRCFQEFGTIEEYAVGPSNWLCVRYADKSQLDRALAASASGLLMQQQPVLLGAARLTSHLASKLGIDIEGGKVSIPVRAREPLRPLGEGSNSFLRHSDSSVGDSIMLTPEKNKNICARLLEWFFVF